MKTSRRRPPFVRELVFQCALAAEGPEVAHAEAEGWRAIVAEAEVAVALVGH